MTAAPHDHLAIRRPASISFEMRSELETFWRQGEYGPFDYTRTEQWN